MQGPLVVAPSFGALGARHHHISIESEGGGEIRVPCEETIEETRGEDIAVSLESEIGGREKCSGITSSEVCGSSILLEGGLSTSRRAMMLGQGQYCSCVVRDDLQCTINRYARFIVFSESRQCAPKTTVSSGKITFQLSTSPPKKPWFPQKQQIIWRI